MSFSTSMPRPSPSHNTEQKTVITRIGHATVLIQLPYCTILTDPVLFDRIGITFWWLPTLGPKRLSPAAFTVEQLPPIDIILLSHAHMDHMDIKTLRALTHRQPYQITCITAFNTKKRIKNFQRKETYELDRDQEFTLQDITITAWETRHRWARYPWTPDRSQESTMGAGHNAYLIEYIQNNENKQIVFGGDTAYTHAFKKWADQHVDVAIMPIWAYDPFRFQHCTPEEALRMALDMHSKAIIPIHRDTFKLSVEPRKDPLKRLIQAIHTTPTIILAIKEIWGEYILY